MLILILVGFILLRLVPYLFWLVPTGYDAGIYLFLFKVFPQVPEWQKLGFSPGLFYLTWPLTKLGLTAEVLKNMYDSAVIGLRQETAYYDF